MNRFRVALIGNPNCGKTTLFNALTGSHQRVGNWPGVTVEKKVGRLTLPVSPATMPAKSTQASPTLAILKEPLECELIDLPGIYSLEQAAPGLDEKIAQDYLAAGDFDVIINIVDAANLQRNLVLTRQLLDLNQPLVIAANMLDVARQQGTRLDLAGLSRRLGVPIIPIIASRKRGLDDLLVATRAVTTGARVDPVINEPLADFAASAQMPVTGDSASEKLLHRYQWVERTVDGVVHVDRARHTLTGRIDTWVLNRWAGVPVFLLMMYLMFTVAINFGAVFTDFFDILLGALVVDVPRWILAILNAPAWLIVLLADGLGGGIQLVATFIPVIGCLFLCLSFLEASGYMSRAAFVVDRLMARVGLPGNAFVPLIVGFGCNVPAVMATRSLGRESDRLLAIAMAPFMSCGARLTVYALFAAAMFPQNGQNIVFGLYLLGIVMAVLTGWLFRKQIFAAETTPSLQEMPAYHLPVLRNILLITWFRLKVFVFRAGKTIVLVVVVLSFLNSIGTNGSFGHEDSDQSLLAEIGKSITPVFAPIGLTQDNWPATVGLFTGLFAKEAVVGTLDALYSSGAARNTRAVQNPVQNPAQNISPGDAQGGAGSDGQAPHAPPDILAAWQRALVSVRDNLVSLAGRPGDPLGLRLDASDSLAGDAEQQGVATVTLTSMASKFGTPFAAFCYLVFVLLYAPCVAVLGATAREAGVKWMLLTFVWTTGLAYVTSSCIYQIGTFTSHPGSSLLWLLGCALVSLLAVKSLKIARPRAGAVELVRIMG